MPPQRRKVVSCGTCRRLRTRCEKLPGLEVCRRCDRLRLQCEFPMIRSSPMGTSAESPAVTFIPHRSVSASQAPVAPEEPIHHIQQRLSAIETTLADLKGLITGSAASAVQPVQDFEDQDVTLEIHSPASSDNLEISHTAAISVVRDMSHIILGTTPGSNPEEGLADCVSIGLIDESFCSRLFDGLRSLPLQRFGLELDPWTIRRSSPLLFATCLLTGLCTIHSLCNSQLHVDLFTHVEELTSKALLRTPLPLESVQAFLMLSVWDLTPSKFYRYIDSWLMSGMGIMHGMLCVDFHKSANERHKNMMKTWNLLHLTHLQFSVGTGQRPIISQAPPESDRAGVMDPWDWMMRAQSQLLSKLFDLIVSRELSLESLECRDLEIWRAENIEIIESDMTLGLAFAYSSAYLMFCRHLLKILSSSSPVLSHLNLRTGYIEVRMNALIGMVIQHCYVIMELYLKIAASEGNVTPAFNHMMCTSAAITVVEFKSRLKDPRETLMLMKRLHRSIEQIGRNDKVIGWAVNVMEIAASERRD